MKNIVKSIIAIALLGAVVSCENEKDLLFLSPEGSFDILSPVSGDGVVLSPDTPLNPGLALTWSKADYGNVPTAITYKVQIDKTGDDFDTPYELTSTTNTFASITSEQLNGAVLSVGLTPFSEGSIDVRIVSSVGTTGSEVMYSSVINYLVTSYSTELPKLAVPGNHQGWNPPTAPRVAASGFGLTNYEGYMWLNGGFKFVAPDPLGNFNWGNTDWGDDGTFSGVLVNGAGETDCTAANGYYRVNANTTTLLYTVVPTTWGIIGAATPGGWDNSTPLTYNPSTKRWEGNVTMTAGEFKFRANNSWTINLGGDPDGDGSMNYDGPNLSVATGGSYFVVLDLSNPRQYTYTLTAN
jgi:starch-binding outer membrane protein SusE/F